MLLENYFSGRNNTKTIFRHLRRSSSGRIRPRASSFFPSAGSSNALSRGLAAAKLIAAIESALLDLRNDPPSTSKLRAQLRSLDNALSDTLTQVTALAALPDAFSLSNLALPSSGAMHPHQTANLMKPKTLPSRGDRLIGNPIIRPVSDP
jgi:hypothetical protein